MSTLVYTFIIHQEIHFLGENFYSQSVNINNSMKQKKIPQRKNYVQLRKHKTKVNQKPETVPKAMEKTEMLIFIFSTSTLQCVICSLLFARHISFFSLPLQQLSKANKCDGIMTLTGFEELYEKRAFTENSQFQINRS